MIWRTIGRLIVVPLAALVAAGVAVAVLLTLGLERFTHATYGQGLDVQNLDTMFEWATAVLQWASAPIVLPALLLLIIGEVAGMFRENTSLIRYWENEFDILKPKKNSKGDRFFRPEDVKNLKLIHHLLRQRKYTIEGAKEFLKSNKTAAEKFEMIRSLQQLKSFLNELKASL